MARSRILIARSPFRVTRWDSERLTRLTALPEAESHGTQIAGASERDRFVVIDSTGAGFVLDGATGQVDPLPGLRGPAKQLRLNRTGEMAAVVTGNELILISLSDGRTVSVSVEPAEKWGRFLAIADHAVVVCGEKGAVRDNPAVRPRRAAGVIDNTDQRWPLNDLAVTAGNRWDCDPESTSRFVPQ